MAVMRIHSHEFSADDAGIDRPRRKLKGCAAVERLWREARIGSNLSGDQRFPQQAFQEFDRTTSLFQLIFPVRVDVPGEPTVRVCKIESDFQVVPDLYG